MSSELLINVTSKETRVALVEDGQVVELHIERADEKSIVGNIYKGRIVRVLPGMQAAFVDIGLERTAFLYAGDAREIVKDYALTLDPDDGDDTEPSEEPAYHVPRDLPIENFLQEGQEILVQVSKEPIGSKGARISSHISLPGRHLVFMPNVEHVGVSRRIKDEKESYR